MKYKLNGLLLLVGGVLSPDLLAYCKKERYEDTGVNLWSEDCTLTPADVSTLNTYYAKGAQIPYKWTVARLPENTSEEQAGITYHYTHRPSTKYQLTIKHPDGDVQAHGAQENHNYGSLPTIKERTFTAATPGTYTFCLERTGKVGWESGASNTKFKDKTLSSYCQTTHVLGGGTGTLSTTKTYKGNVDVNWRTSGSTIDFEGATDIKIQKKLGSNAWVDAGSTDISNGSHTISLTSAGSYSIRLKGCRSDRGVESCSPYSTVSGTVQYLAPGMPSNISASGLINGILPTGNTRLSWSRVSAAANSVGFDVYYQLSGSDKKYTATTLDVSGLQDAQNYSYKVRACNIDGLCSGYNSAVSFKVELPPNSVSLGLQNKELLVPIKSSGITMFIPVVKSYPIYNGAAVVTDNSITLEWNNAGEGVTYQFVYIKDGVESSIVTVNGTTKVVALTQDGDYTFKVRACRTSCGAWQEVNIITKVEKPTKPKTPVILAPSTVFEPFKVTWPKVSSVAGYMLSINNTSIDFVCSEAKSECSWSSDESLPLGDHWFRLHAYNEKNGHTALSDMVAVKVTNKRDETYLLRKRLYWEEADQQENPAAGMYDRELAAFRYQTKLFERDTQTKQLVNSAINGKDTVSFTNLWGNAERTRADDVKAELEYMKGLPQFVNDEVVNLLWLDVIHDTAEADLILSNQYLDYARGANLAFSNAIDVERELANAESAVDSAFTRYRSLLAGSGSDYAQRLLAYSANRGKRSPRYWDGSLARPVYSEGEIREVKRRLANGELSTVPETLLFSGYKDVVMVYNVMAQKLDTFYQHTRSRMISGHLGEAYYAEYVHELNTLRSDVQVIDNTLKALFGDVITSGSDIDELPIAHGKFVSANTRLDNLLSWLKGETNLMGLPFGAFPVLHNHNEKSTFDYLSKGLVPDLVTRAETAYTTAHNSYDAFNHNLSTIATTYDDKFDQYNHQLKQLLGWELRSQNCIIDGERCFVENKPTEGSQLSWQQQNIDAASLNLDRAISQLRQRVGSCELTNGATGRITYDSPQNEILNEETCAAIAAQKSTEDGVPYTHIFQKGTIHLELESILAQKEGVHEVSSILLHYGEEHASIQQQLAKIRAEAERSRHKVSMFKAISSIGTSFLGGAQGYASAIEGVTNAVGEMVSHRANMRYIKKEGELLAQSARLSAEERVKINDTTLALLDAEQSRRIETLWLDMKTLELNVAQAELSLEHETERFIGTYRQAAWLISQMQQLQSSLSGRYGADPIHAKRLSKAMLEMENTFTHAQEWVFYTALAYNNKWNRSVTAEMIDNQSFSGTASTPRPKYTEREIQVMRAQHASDLSTAFYRLISDDHNENNQALVSSKSYYSMKRHGFGYGEQRNDVIDSTPGIDCAPCTSEEAFERRLAKSAIQVGGEPGGNSGNRTEALKIGFSTAKTFDAAFAAPQFIFNPLPPGFEWYNCPANGGNHLNKIQSISVNVITYSARFYGTLNYTLSMGGQSVRRTPHLGTYVFEKGLLRLQNEFEYLPIHGWDIGSNGKLKVDGNKIFGQAQASIDAERHEVKPLINSFNEQNIAATAWVLTLDLANSGITISDIYDIELEFNHTHTPRSFPTTCSDLLPSTFGTTEVMGRVMHSSLLGNASDEGIWIETNKGPYQVKSSEL
ncbi:fibronectin type III domain-containing protein [Pseudoalteromonas luteoviolacea]|uniref:Fibronectin type-III domain-containing protein n=1 Tax=Pseudoalteromonas luteoviolacea (strain 2ta16) TaxID=1353533 RepID=V4HV36_PSEL2|nr:fibronectin type III domain-containing protein [Pseudoalteromonas luteoviolacea]ESP93653.1 hypothetical protein PL2TA16_03039 [Pseudoalteromonas luteoviolacea 2ta16]KZN42442.1 hypothetical protein N483_13050 [Pseudoalteromonas luteoviolacea NCIMB 1944]